jgi:hypothetical protein
MADENVITKEIMTVYIAVLEKHVQQMSTVVSYLEQMDEKLVKVEEHFHNGFRSELIEHSNALAKDLGLKIDELNKVLSSHKETVKEQMTALSTHSEKQITSLTNNYDIKTEKLLGQLKVDRAINIVGWGALIITLIVKIFVR